MTEPLLTTYAFDAYCGWCWGLSPALHEFAAINRDRIRLRVLSGGLFIGEGARPYWYLYAHPGRNASDYKS